MEESEFLPIYLSHQTG